MDDWRNQAWLLTADVFHGAVRPETAGIRYAARNLKSRQENSRFQAARRRMFSHAVPVVVGHDQQQFGRLSEALSDLRILFKHLSNRFVEHLLILVALIA